MVCCEHHNLSASVVSLGSQINWSSKNIYLMYSWPLLYRNIVDIPFSVELK